MLMESVKPMAAMARGEHSLGVCRDVLHGIFVCQTHLQKRG